MSKGYSINEDNKPTLFTWDLETEYQHIDQQLKDERFEKEVLEQKRIQLRQLKVDVHDIILAKKINMGQVERIFDLVRHGRSGVWETAILYIERLAFHFEVVKSRLATALTSSDSKYVAKLIASIGLFFDQKQMREVLIHLLGNENKEVRKRTIARIFELRLSEMRHDLVRLKEIESNKGVIEIIEFTLVHIDSQNGKINVRNDERTS